jgi:cell division protein FtsW
MGQQTFVNTNPRMAKAVAPPRTGRLNVDLLLAAAVVTLLAFGLMMVYSASLPLAGGQGGNGAVSAIFERQLLVAAIGCVIMVGLAFFDYHRFNRQIVLLIWAGTIFLLLAVLLFGTEAVPGGRKALLNGSFQPSELAKLTIIIYLSFWLVSKGDMLKKASFGLFPLLGILGVTAGLVLVQIDVSAAMTIIFLGGVLFYIAGGKWKQIAAVILLTAALGAIVAVVYPNALNRLTEWWNGLRDPKRASDQVKWTMNAIVNGGLFGKGIAHSISKFIGLPAAHTDSIFAVVAEETGLLGSLAMVGLYMVILWRGMIIAKRAADDYGRYLASGITIWILFEALVNIGNIVSIVPVAGNALPLVSYGGSNLLTTLAALGILFNISRTGAAAKAETDGRPISAVVDLRWRDRGRRVSRSVRPASPRK